MIDVKEYIYSIYDVLKEGYRIAAATEPSENVPSIGTNQTKWLMDDILGALDKEDSGKFKAESLDKILTQVNLGSKGPNNPSKAMVRH